LRFENDFRRWMKKYLGGPIELSVEPTLREEEKLRAVKALHILASKLSSDCLIIAGDNLFTFSLKPMMKRYRELKAPLIAIYDVGSPELAKTTA